MRDDAGGERGRRREVVGILLLGTSLFLGLSVVSLQLGHGRLMGPCGEAVGLALYALVGVGAYLAAAGIGVWAVRSLAGRRLGVASLATAAAVMGVLALGVLLHLALGKFRLRGYGPGGVLGEYAAELVASVVGRPGAVLFSLMGIALSLVLATPLSMGELGGRAARGIGRGLAAVGFGIGWLGSWAWGAVKAIFPARGEDAEVEAELEARRAVIHGEETRKLDVGREDDTDAEPVIRMPKAKRRRAQSEPVSAADHVAVAVDDHVNDHVAVNDHAHAHEDVYAAEEAHEAYEESASSDQFDVVGDVAAEAELAPSAAPLLAAPDMLVQGARSVPSPRIVEPVAVAKPAAREALDYIPAAGGYALPELELLDDHPAGQSELDRQGKEEMLSLADKLQKTLADYGVKGHVQEIHPGPVVTMYEFVPAAGTKLSKITSLSNDLAMAMAALRVRIVAPIPGKSSVGIEVPYKKRATVYFREILGDGQVGSLMTKSRLTIGLGKDIAGAPVAVDLAKMPHLLVAGTTGSGKSVGVNGMICSLLYNATPDEVRMILIDPKMVELSVYEGIPHLLLPVVTDPKKANLALRWAVEEMERRYELVSKAGVRDILSYNKRIEKLAAEPAPAPIDDEEAFSMVPPPPPPKKLPYIVVVIDEFADLMMVAPKDVETSVARIAQKARAVGIHLIVATQRPSVDVITGLIKANFPSRIGYQVASKIDSRTILDQQGAENLLGNGDMLFTDRGQALRRIHGAFVSDDEVKRVVQHLMQQGKPVYDLDILKPRDEEGEEGGGPVENEGHDALYDQAVRIVCDTRNASVSMIQRRLQIGFNRASRMVERMEREGIVGAANGSKPREVLAQAV